MNKTITHHLTTIILTWITMFICVTISNVSYANDNDFLPPAKDCKIVKHHNYTLCFNTKYKDALWVSYELTDKELAKNFKRTNDFKPDNMVKSAKLSDYSHSGYDRGHLAPAADMEFSKVAIHESFYLSNMTPQLPGFNRGIWKNLESQVRAWARKNHKIYVITAGVLQGDKYIGPDHVLVPNQFYKIIYAPNKNKAIAFLLPNKASNKSLKSFIVPIKKIDDLTHITFFKSLTNKQITTPSNPNLWSWNTHSSSYNHSSKHTIIIKTNTKNTNASIVKMSKSHICHDSTSKYYARTKHFTSYNSLKACLNAGGRLPRR